MSREYSVTVGFTFLSEDGHEPSSEEVYKHLLLALTDPHKIATHEPTDRTETTNDILYIEIEPLDGPIVEESE